MRKIFTLLAGLVMGLSVMAETINITMTDSVAVMDEVAIDGTWMIVGESEEWEVILSNDESTAVTQLAGTYTLADLDDTYTCVYDYINGDDYVFFTDGSVTITVDDVAFTIHAVGSFTGEDGNTYNIDLLFHKPHQEATANLTFDNGVVGEGSLCSVITAENENGDGIYIAFDEEVALEDLTTAGVYYATVTVAGEDFDYYTITLNVVKNADGSCTVTADILCYNNTLYHVVITVSAEEQGIENVVLKEKAEKIVVDGAVYVIRNNRMYNISGARVR